MGRHSDENEHVAGRHVVGGALDLRERATTSFGRPHEHFVSRARRSDERDGERRAHEKAHRRPPFQHSAAQEEPESDGDPGERDIQVSGRVDEVVRREEEEQGPPERPVEQERRSGGLLRLESGNERENERDSEKGARDRVMEEGLDEVATEPRRGIDEQVGPPRGVGSPSFPVTAERMSAHVGPEREKDGEEEQVGSGAPQKTGDLASPEARPGSRGEGPAPECRQKEDAVLLGEEADGERDARKSEPGASMAARRGREIGAHGAEKRPARERFVATRHPDGGLDPEGVEHEKKRREHRAQETAAEHRNESADESAGRCVQDEIGQVKAEGIEIPELRVERERPRPHGSYEALRPGAADLVRGDEAQELEGALVPGGADLGVVVGEKEPIEGARVDEKARGERGEETDDEGRRSTGRR